MNPILLDLARNELRLAIHGIPTARGILQDLVQYLNNCQTEQQFQEAGMLFAECDSIREKITSASKATGESKNNA